MLFISAKHKDLDLARDLAKRLEKAGLKVIKPVESIDDADDFKSRISSMKKAEEILVLVTVNSVTSKGLLFEMGAATSLEKRLTPIILGVEPRNLPPIIKEMEYVKYGDMDRFISKLQQRRKEPSQSAA